MVRSLHFSGLIQTDPSSWAFLVCGIVRDGRMEEEAALRDHSVAIRLDPESALAQGFRGLLNSRKGDYDRATADESEAIKLDPSKPMAFAVRALLWENRPDCVECRPWIAHSKSPITG